MTRFKVQAYLTTQEMNVLEQFSEDEFTNPLLKSALEKLVTSSIYVQRYERALSEVTQDEKDELTAILTFKGEEA